MPNFDYAIAVGICTLAILVGLRVAIPWMRSASRRRTDEMLLRIAESDEELDGNKNPTSRVETKDESESDNSGTDG